MSTEQEALQKAADLMDEGYDCIAFDEPHRAMRGVVCFKKIAGEVGSKDYQEDSHELVWPEFDQPYETDKEIVSPAELVQFAKEHETKPCDNPKALRMGLVYYDHDRKVAVVRESKVTDLRRASKETMDEMLGLRDMRIAEHMRNERVREVHDKIAKLRKYGS
jgi:hypothetical protein